MEKLASETLPPGMAFEWTDLTFQEKLAGNAGLWVFPLAVLLVCLILAVPCITTALRCRSRCS